MKREITSFDINLDGLLADIDGWTYICLAFAVLILSFIGWLNERRMHDGVETNSLWTIIISLFPSNCSMWRYQNGITRKVIMITCGFLILFSTTYYQSNLLTDLLTVDVTTTIDAYTIAERVRSFNAKLLFYGKNSLIENDIVSSKTPALSELAHALKVNPPLYNYTNVIYELNTNNAIIVNVVSDLYKELSKLPSSECANNIVISLDEIPLKWATLILRKDSKLLEPLNVIIAERYNYAQDILDKPQLPRECHELLFPLEKTMSSFVPLTLYTLSGSFTFLIFFSFMAILVFISEFVYERYANTEAVIAVIHIEFSKNAFHRFSLDKQQEIIDTYNQIVELTSADV